MQLGPGYPFIQSFIRAFVVDIGMTVRTTLLKDLDELCRECLDSGHLSGVERRRRTVNAILSHQESLPSRIPGVHCFGHVKLVNL